MNRYIITLLLSFVMLIAKAEFVMPTKIILTHYKSDKLIYPHKMQPSQTVYSLSKFFKVPIEEIKSLNPNLDFDDLKINQSVNIPIQKSQIIPTRAQFEKKSYVAVFYKVKPKETLYSISTRYFNQDVDNVKKINNLHNNELKVGQELLIGWYEYNQIYRDRVLNPQLVNNTQSTEENADNDSGYIVISDGNEFRPVSRPSYIDEKLSKDPFEAANGIFEGRYDEKPAVYERKITAHWNKNSNAQDELFVLFSDAKPNSYVEIFNPMLNRMVIAKVVGKIPESTYTPDTELIVSPLVAKRLGAIDKKFFVSMKFIR